MSIPLPPHDELPLTEAHQSAGIIWRRRYHINEYEQVTVVYQRRPELHSVILRAEWSYPDTQPLYFDRLTSEREQSALLFEWEEWTLRQLLIDLTHMARKMFSVRGMSYPECVTGTEQVRG